MVFGEAKKREAKKKQEHCTTDTSIHKCLAAKLLLPRKRS